MSRADAIRALGGSATGFVSGVTWLSADVLETLAFGTAARGPAESLAAIASALELDFAVVAGEQPWAPEAVDTLREADVASVWAVSGVLGRVGEHVGWSEMLRMTVAEPGALAAHIAEVLHDALDAVRAGASAGADAVMVADDLAGATGALVSPDFALDALVPCYRSLANEIGLRGLPAVFHSDGDIRVLLPALRRAGFSAVHLAGLGEDALPASLGAAGSAGLVALGGLEAAALLGGARRLGARAGELAAASALMVCDDGGITSGEEVAALASALEAARAAYGDSAHGGERP